MKVNSILYVASVFAAPLLHGCPSTSNAQTPAAPTLTSKTPAISPANFRSLKLEQSGGYSGIRTQMLIRGRTVRLRIDPSHKKPPHDQTLSIAEFKTLLKLLNDAQFPKISGTYDSPGMADGIHQVVTLTLQGPAKKPVSFVVDSYGNTAPKAFDKVSVGLDTLQFKKFPASADEYHEH